MNNFVVWHHVYYWRSGNLGMDQGCYDYENADVLLNVQRSGSMLSMLHRVLLNV